MDLGLSIASSATQEDEQGGWDDKDDGGWDAGGDDADWNLDGDSSEMTTGDDTLQLEAMLDQFVVGTNPETQKVATQKAHQLQSKEAQPPPPPQQKNTTCNAANDGTKPDANDAAGPQELQLPEVPIYLEAEPWEYEWSSQSSHEIELLKKYQQEQGAAGSAKGKGGGETVGAAGGGKGGAGLEAMAMAGAETEEKLPSGERMLVDFQKRLARYPVQCLRYAYEGRPMWPSASFITAGISAVTVAGASTGVSSTAKAGTAPAPMGAVAAAHARVEEQTLVEGTGGKKKGKSKGKIKAGKPTPPAAPSPPACVCGAQRVFEMQVMHVELNSNQT
jgi:hypothetical protein